MTQRQEQYIQKYFNQLAASSLVRCWNYSQLFCKTYSINLEDARPLPIISRAERNSRRLCCEVPQPIAALSQSPSTVLWSLLPCGYLFRGALKSGRGALFSVRGSLNSARGALFSVRGTLNTARGDLYP
jgi:hypothetical protein